MATVVCQPILAAIFVVSPLPDMLSNLWMKSFAANSFLCWWGEASLVLLDLCKCFRIDICRRIRKLLGNLKLSYFHMLLWSLHQSRDENENAWLLPRDRQYGVYFGPQEPQTLLLQSLPRGRIRDNQKNKISSRLCCAVFLVEGTAVNNSSEAGFFHLLIIVCVLSKYLGFSDCNVSREWLCLPRPDESS